jgi:hypothetical protein
LSSQVVVGLGLAIVLSSGCVSRIDRFAVENALLHAADNPLLDNANEADWFSDEWTTVIANAQTMDRGGQTVISRRSFDQGSLLSIDDEKFEMISLAIPHVSDVREYDVERDAITVVYTSGFGGPFLGCFGRGRTGTVAVHAIEKDRLDVEFSVDVAMFGPAACVDVRVTDRGQYRLMEFPELEPWFGGPATNQYEKVYPPK